MKKRDKFLIIRLSAIGDTIHTIPLAWALKRAYPDCEIGWVVEDKASQFVLNNPLVDKVFVVPKKKWRKEKFSAKCFFEFFEIIKEINNESYTVAIDVQQLFKSGVFLFFCNAERKLSMSDAREFSNIFANELITPKAPLFDFNYHVIKRNLEFADYLGAATEEVNFCLPESSVKIIEKIDFLLADTDKTKPTLIFAPATTWENKHWSEQYWAETANAFCDKANIIFTGSNDDNELISRIINKIDKANAAKILNLAGKTDLNELAELFKRVDFVVSPDSGSAHIAWAAQSPYVVTLFTSTASKRNGPFGEKYFSLQSPLECSPCFKRKCLQKDNQTCCINSIKPAIIIDKINQLLFSGGNYFENN